MSEFYFHTTKLHQSIRDNEYDIVESLINQGADIFEKDDDGVSPLELAEILQNQPLIKLLKTKLNHNTSNNKK